MDSGPDPARARALVHCGAGLHAAGRIGEAEACYREALAMAPDHADALHLLGVVAYQSGHYTHAEHLIRRALRRQPDTPMFLANLGRALLAQQRPEDAIDSLERSVVLQPASAANLCDLGAAQAAVGRAAAAQDAFRRALDLAPGLVAAKFGLARIAEQAGRGTEAAAIYREVLSAEPAHVEALINLGNLCQDAERLDEACGFFSRAAAADPKFAPAHFNLGDAWRALRRYEDAERAFATAARLDPAMAEAHAGRAAVLRSLGRQEEASASLERSLAGTRVPQALVARGNLLMAAHRIDDALADFDAALSDDPKDAEAHFSRGLALLLTGRFEEGWAEYEHRFHRRRLRWRRDELLARPRWTGESVAGRTVLLHAEQGLGDTIQFLRYAPLVAARGARVVLEVQPELLALAQGPANVEVVVAREEPLPDFELQCPLLSLPRVFGTRVDTVPAAVPYLSIDPDRAVRLGMAERTAAAALHVGLVWSGNPNHPGDAERSIDPLRFAALGRVDGVVFHSLQKGAGAAGLERIREVLPVRELAVECVDFGDTAAAVAALDLVIGVDTSVAHLAGALGCPVWTLLAHSPDWRWMLGREDTPWYPTMRLFRQRRPGDWDEVMARVLVALRDAAARRGQYSRGPNPVGGRA